MPSAGEGPRIDAGIRILTHLNQPSELLRLLLHILDEGCSAVESYVKFPGKINVERSCLQVSRLFCKTRSSTVEVDRIL